jgi:hypothetical protein
MTVKNNIFGGNIVVVGDNSTAHDFVLNSSQTPQNTTSDQSTQAELSTTSPSSNNGSKNMDLSPLMRLLRERPWIVFVLAGLGIFLLLLVATGKIRIPNVIEPNKSETKSQEEVKVKVNLECKWKSQSRLTKPIQSATVIGRSVRTGEPIKLFGRTLDSNGKIPFVMGRKDLVQITITHPDIRDSQIQIPIIQITESDSELKDQNYVVIWTDCLFDAKH